MTDVTERGLDLFAEMMGEENAAGLRKAAAGEGVGADLARLAIDFAFGSVWARAGLTREQRSLVTIGVLIAQGQPRELKNHVRIGIANGLTTGEIEETLMQALPYVGFPAVASAATAIAEALHELGDDPHSNAAGERTRLATGET